MLRTHNKKFKQIRHCIENHKIKAQFIGILVIKMRDSKREGTYFYNEKIGSSILLCLGIQLIMNQVTADG